MTYCFCFKLAQAQEAQALRGSSRRGRVELRREGGEGTSKIFAAQRQFASVKAVVSFGSLGLSSESQGFSAVEA